MIRLASHSKVPPGNFWFQQSFELNGKSYTKAWASTPEIGALASKVSGFRKANGLPRPHIMEALEDVDSFTCARLGNNPKWCIETDKSWDELVASFHGPGCATCNQKGTGN